MNERTAWSGRGLALLAAGVFVLSAAQGARAQGEAWTIEQGDVRVTCFLTVGGSFEAKTTSFSGRLAKPADGSPYRGAVSVDLGTLDSGISLRNDHLRHKYLEVGKGEGYDKASMDDIHLDKASGAQERSTFSGTLHLHGTSRPVKGQAQIRRTPAGVRVDATFPVALADFGIADPRYLGVGVKNQVQVRVTFVARPAGPRS